MCKCSSETHLDLNVHMIFFERLQTLKPLKLESCFSGLHVSDVSSAAMLKRTPKITFTHDVA